MIDLAILPRSALLDAGVLMRAVGQQSKDPRAPTCREFVEAMLKEKRDIFVAAPAFAEYLSDPSGKPPPLVNGILVVAFDRAAATMLAERAPESVLRQEKKDGPIAYVKYDAMIAACALRWSAEVLVTLDGRYMTSIAKILGVKVAKPSDYEHAQATLPGV